MAVFRHVDPPQQDAPRAASIVEQLIVANVAAQRRILDDPAIVDKSAAIFELQQQQSALYRERDRARYAARGIQPERWT